MKNRFARRARRAAVTDPVVAALRRDYAHAFEVRLPGPDPYPPETWVRVGLDAIPKVVEPIVGLLGLREAPEPSPGSLSVFRVVESGPEVVHLEASVPLMRVVAVGRRVGPARRMMTTVLRYERPVLARLLWAVVVNGSRRQPWRRGGSFCHGQARSPVLGWRTQNATVRMEVYE